MEQLDESAAPAGAGEHTAASGVRTSGAGTAVAGTLDTKRPFTRADAVRAGISAKTLRGSRFRRLFRDVYIGSEVRDDLLHRVQGALLLHPPTAYASHFTAAELYGVVVPASSLVHVSVFQAEDRHWCAGVKPHVAPSRTEVSILRGVRISDKYRMFVELAGVLELVDLVVAGDNMLRVFGITAATLRAELDRLRCYWSGAARFAAGFVRDGVRSPMESRLRMLLVLAGLPEPRVNLTIRDDDGEIVFMFDLAYEQARVAVEFEGRHHVEVVRQWEKDIDRDERAELSGWRLVKITSNGLFVEPGRTVDRVWRALRSRGLQLPRPTDAWRPHFPGRPATVSRRFSA